MRNLRPPLGLVVTLATPMIFIGMPTAAAEVSAPSIVEFVVDVSGSMQGQPLDQAKNALRASAQNLSPSDLVGIRSFAGDCGHGGDVAMPIGNYEPTTFDAAVNNLIAGGGTPTPDALRAAATDLPATGDRTIVLISDGQSTCGDPCPIAGEIKNTLGVDFRVHAVGFNAPAAASTELTCIANVTGGQYIQATNTASLQAALTKLVGSSGLYVALGDSYSSGEGNPPFDAGTDDPNNLCHRSGNAWPRLLDDSSTSLDLAGHLACSGAIFDHVTAYGRYSAPDNLSQIDQLKQDIARGLTPSVVTITIGGNDVLFGPVLENCVTLNCVRNGNVKRIAEYIKGPAFRTQAARTYQAVKDAVPSTTRVVVVGYPNIVSTRPGNARLHCSWLNSSESKALVGLAKTLDSTLAKVAKRSRVEYDSTLSALKGHELCTGRSYVVALTAVGGPVRGHPTLQGQQRIAADVKKYLRVS
jgi:lysophospholipase L1-like esterase